MSKRILIASSHIATAEQIVLEARGYQLLVVQEIHSAVSLILDDPPDMLILSMDFGEEKDILGLLGAVKGCLQKTNIPVLIVLDEDRALSGMDWQKFPADDIVVMPFSPEILLVRIGLAEARMIRVFDNNPLSKLPGNTSILRAMQKAIDAEESFAVCYIDIDNFKPFNDRYGFSQGDDVILMVARIAVNVVDELARDGSFVGHVGGDDYVFIVKEKFAAEVCKRILSNFEVVRNMILPPEDVKAGCYIEKDRQGRETVFGLLSLSIAVVVTGTRHFSHYGEISAIASELKHFVKQKEGNNYMIDRRSQEEQEEKKKA